MPSDGDTGHVTQLLSRALVPPLLQGEAEEKELECSGYKCIKENFSK